MKKLCYYVGAISMAVAIPLLLASPVIGITLIVACIVKGIFLNIMLTITVVIVLMLGAISASIVLFSQIDMDSVKEGFCDIAGIELELE